MISVVEVNVDVSKAFKAGFAGAHFQHCQKAGFTEAHLL